MIAYSLSRDTILTSSELEDKIVVQLSENWPNQF